jgi:hypothetical protein
MINNCVFLTGFIGFSKNHYFDVGANLFAQLIVFKCE